MFTSPKSIPEHLLPPPPTDLKGRVKHFAREVVPQIKYIHYRTVSEIELRFESWQRDREIDKELRDMQRDLDRMVAAPESHSDAPRKRSLVDWPDLEEALRLTCARVIRSGSLGSADEQADM